MYASHMIPHVRLTFRAITEVNPKRLAFHSVNHLKSDIFQPSNAYTSEFVTPNAIYIEPTMVCNRRCDGCYPLNLGAKSTISVDLTQKVFDAASELRVHYIAWIGGEPLLPLVQDTTLGVSERNKKVAVVLCTNGDFLNERVADRIANAYNVVPFLSIDGFEATHNKRRGGKYSYWHVITAMDLLKERGVMQGYSTTLTAKNFREVTSEQFINEMISHGAFVGSYLLFLSNSKHPLQLTPEQFAEAIERLNNLSTKKPLYILSTEYGRLNGGPVMRGKRLIGMTVDPWGGVRTERGGDIIASISQERGLVNIIKSEEFQTIFRRKANGDDDAPQDGMKRNIEDISFNLLSRIESP